MQSAHLFYWTQVTFVEYNGANFIGAKILTCVQKKTLYIQCGAVLHFQTIDWIRNEVVNSGSFTDLARRWPLCCILYEIRFTKNIDMDTKNIYHYQKLIILFFNFCYTYFKINILFWVYKQVSMYVCRKQVTVYQLIILKDKIKRAVMVNFK